MNCSEVSLKSFRVEEKVLSTRERWRGMYTNMKVLFLLAMSGFLVSESQAFYNPEQGRWQSRDPAKEIDVNLYGFVRNNAVGNVDAKGLWCTDVHYGWTRAWAYMAGYAFDAARIVAEWDEKVDYGVTNPLPWGNQGYHFNRSQGGVDSRKWLSDYHLSDAKYWCTWNKYIGKGDDPDRAAASLGSALHPLQDIVAHGDFGLITPILAPWHNWASEQWFSGSPVSSLPDRFDMDAFGGPNGIPAGRGIIQSDITGGTAYFVPGSQRRNKTEADTKKLLNDFLDYVRTQSKPCGKCREFFLKKP